MPAAVPSGRSYAQTLIRHPTGSLSSSPSPIPSVPSSTLTVAVPPSAPSLDANAPTASSISDWPSLSEASSLGRTRRGRNHLSRRATSPQTDAASTSLPPLSDQISQSTTDVLPLASPSRLRVAQPEEHNEVEERVPVVQRSPNPPLRSPSIPSLHSPLAPPDPRHPSPTASAPIELPAPLTSYTLGEMGIMQGRDPLPSTSATRSLHFPSPIRSPALSSTPTPLRVSPAHSPLAAQTHVELSAALLTSLRSLLATLAPLPSSGSTAASSSLPFLSATPTAQLSPLAQRIRNHRIEQTVARLDLVRRLLRLLVQWEVLEIGSGSASATVNGGTAPRSNPHAIAEGIISPPPTLTTQERERQASAEPASRLVDLRRMVGRIDEALVRFELNRGEESELDGDEERESMLSHSILTGQVSMLRRRGAIYRSISTRPFQTGFPSAPPSSTHLPAGTSASVPAPPHYSPYPQPSTSTNQTSLSRPPWLLPTSTPARPAHVVSSAEIIAQILLESSSASASPEPASSSAYHQHRHSRTGSLNHRRQHSYSDAPSDTDSTTSFHHDVSSRDPQTTQRVAATDSAPVSNPVSSPFYSTALIIACGAAASTGPAASSPIRSAHYTRLNPNVPYPRSRDRSIPYLPNVGCGTIVSDQAVPFALVNPVHSLYHGGRSAPPSAHLPLDHCASLAVTFSSQPGLAELGPDLFASTSTTATTSHAQNHWRTELLEEFGSIELQHLVQTQQTTCMSAAVVACVNCGLALGLSLIPLSPHHTSNDQRTEVILSRRRITVIAPSSDSPQCVYFQAFPKEYYAEEGEEAEEEEQQLREPLISTSGVADPDDEDNMPWVANTNRKLAERPNGGRDEWGSHHGRQAQGRSSQYGDGAMSRRRVGPVGR